MAVKSVPPTGSYDAADNSAQRHNKPRDGGFAAVYEQARRAAENDNTGQNNPGAREQQTAQNRKYIEKLHEKVDTLRGEILVRVIQHAGTKSRADFVGQRADVSRLTNRLESMRERLRQEEVRLSGKLFDETV